ncbi:hypothetical protein C8R43DRAFT_1107199 [Mycena crocata]|nr:hypothetical protein C8R43DRAFT_1107199 [Mycena crocata]
MTLLRPTFASDRNLYSLFIRNDFSTAENVWPRTNLIQEDPRNMTEPAADRARMAEIDAQILALTYSLRCLRDERILKRSSSISFPSILVGLLRPDDTTGPNMPQMEVNFSVHPLRGQGGCLHNMKKNRVGSKIGPLETWLKQVEAFGFLSPFHQSRTLPPVLKIMLNCRNNINGNVFAGDASDIGELFDDDSSYTVSDSMSDVSSRSMIQSETKNATYTLATAIVANDTGANGEEFSRLNRSDIGIENATPREPDSASRTTMIQFSRDVNGKCETF